MPPLPLARRFLFLLLACALLLAGCARSPEKTPEEAANAFFAAVARGDFKTAYDSAAFSFQAAQTRDSFAANSRDLGFIGARPPVWTRTTPHEKQSLLSGIITNQSGQALNLSATLTLEDGAWKIYALHTDSPEADHQSENRFTLVGKGSDFQDVYRQPMPPPPQVAALAQETMAQFAAAIRDRDFNPFYHYVSQAWREGTVPSAQDAHRTFAVPGDTSVVPDARITVKLLESNFGPFIQKNIDLGPMSRTAPVFTEPPHIDSNGALNVAGYSTDGRLHAVFSFQYVYELPKWRLSALNIEIRE